jgi:hypothetical protein
MLLGRATMATATAREAASDVATPQAGDGGVLVPILVAGSSLLAIGASTANILPGQVHPVLLHFCFCNRSN